MDIFFDKICKQNKESAAKLTIARFADSLFY